MSLVSNRVETLALLSFVVLGFLIYSNSTAVPFYLDDMRNITQNPHIQLTKLDLQGITRAGFESPCSNRPIANISFALNYYFHQNDVVGYHLVNIAIHITAGILLYLFTKASLCISMEESGQLYKPSICNSPKPSIAAFFVALIWLVHPIQTQSVTYVVQRMNSMASMLYVLSMFLYVKGRLIGKNQRSWPWFAGCVLTGILAMGSKEIAVTLPFFILLYEWYFFQDLSTAWLKRHILYVTGGLILCSSLAVLYVGTNPVQTVLSGYGHRDFDLVQRMFTELRVILFYMSLLIFPHPSRLNLNHDFPVSLSLINPITTLFSLAAIVGLVVLSVLMAKEGRLISFCLLWFLGNLVIESSILPLELIFEHRTYLPSMSFCLMIVVLTYRYIRRDRAVIGILCGFVLLSSMWTYERNEVWKEPVTFWTDCAQKSEKKVRPQYNLANALVRLGKLNEAISYYAKALQIDPAYGQVHYNLALALAKQGRLDEAIAHFSQALKINPDFAEAHNNLAIVFLQQGNLKEAIDHCSKALQIRPDYALAYYNLGLIRARQGDFKAAVSHYSKVLEIMPDFAKARRNLQNALKKACKSGKTVNSM